MAKQDVNVGLDSQSFSYLLDAISGISEPTDLLALEKKALLRTWFYQSGTFVLTETVVSEVRRIPKIERRALHESFIQTLFLDYPVHDLITVKARAEKFQNLHSGHSDCRILAEAEEIKLDTVLTYDYDFWRRLQNASHITKLMKPSEYWTSLNIPKGARPKTIPHNTNPLSQQEWWRW